MGLLQAKMGICTNQPVEWGGIRALFMANVSSDFSVDRQNLDGGDLKKPPEILMTLEVLW